MPIHNYRLRTTLEDLCKKAIDFYNSLSLPNRNPRDVGIALFNFDSEIEKIPEFTEAAKIMKNSRRINFLLGKLVGTALDKSTVDSAETCILRFIYQVYLQKYTFEQALFNDKYKRFEELFYSNILHFIDDVELYNFESEVDEIVLEDGLRIKKNVVAKDEQAKIQETRYRPYSQFSKSDFIIERGYAKQKMVGNENTNFNTEEINKELNESGDLFDQIIKSLRILKSSGVYRNHTINTRELTFAPYAGIISRSPFIENITFGDKCTISSSEIVELKTIFKKIHKSSDAVFNIASNRLGFGLERRFDEDRLLDFMIGLESLYLPDGNEELTFRLSLRIAFILNKKSDDIKDTFRFIKKMYRLRSKIVHGKKYELIKDDIKRLEEILRKSLKICMFNPLKFSLDKYDNNGNLTKEGILDNVYFKK